MNERKNPYEDWFKLLWNRAVEAVDETPECTDPDHPLFGLLETMHGIAEDQPDMWLQPPAEPNGVKPDPILGQFAGY